MVRESHGAFARKTILAAKEQTNKREDVPFWINCRSSKFFDSEIIDLVDETKIEENVSKSCDFASAIQACRVDLETTIEAEENTERVRRYKE